MSFRKRNIILGSTTNPALAQGGNPLPPGIRPSPLDGRLITSSGTASLDRVIAGAHAGIALGTSLLIEENGTTDFGGILLRYYAAEGLVQGHCVHILGHGEGWKVELPGLVTEGSGKSVKAATPPEQMKIAWRYDALSRSTTPTDCLPTTVPLIGQGDTAFCHEFDLARRLDSRTMRGQIHGHLPAALSDLSLGAQALHSASPLSNFVKSLAAKLRTSGPDVIHRVVVPGFLGPELYNPPDCYPRQVLAFLHSLKALLQQYPGRATAMITLSTTLFPRSSGLTRWIELLNDGVLELISLAHNDQVGLDLGSGPGATIQGFVKVHKVLLYHERGIVSRETKASFDSLSFRLSGTSGMLIAPYSLPPVGENKPETKSTKPKVTVKDNGGLEF